MSFPEAMDFGHLPCSRVSETEKGLWSIGTENAAGGTLQPLPRNQPHHEIGEVALCTMVASSDPVEGPESRQGALTCRRDPAREDQAGF